MTSATYYENSYPPGVLGLGVLVVSFGSGWAGSVADIGSPVGIVVTLDGTAVPVPDQVDWGDGTRDQLLTHTYSATIATGRISVRVGANLAQSSPFTATDIGVQAAAPEPPAPEPEPEPEPPAPEPEPEPAPVEDGAEA